MQISSIKDNNEMLQIQDQMEVSDAYSFVIRILDERIRYYQTLYRRHWEKNHETESTYYDQKVAELKEEKERIKSFAQKANSENKTISLNCNMQIQAV